MSVFSSKNLSRFLPVRYFSLKRFTTAPLLLALFLSSAPLRAEAPIEVAPSESIDSADLVIGLTGKYPPFNYYDDNGKLTGFDVEMAKEICRIIDIRCAFRTLQWDGILASLMAGKIDVIIGSMAVTEERSKMASFTVPYYESGAQLYVRPDTGKPDSKGFRIGVTLGTTHADFARKTFPKAQIRTYKGDTEVLHDIQSGRLDGMVTDRLVGAYMIRKFKANLEIEGKPLFIEKIAIPVKPKRKELLGKLNEAISEIRSSSFYDDLMDKYFGVKALEGYTSGKSSMQPLFVAKLLLRGLLATAKVAFTGIGLGCALAVILAFLLIALPGVPRKTANLYVDFIRSTPFLIQLFAIYFGLPAVGIKISAWNSAVIAIGLHSSAYLSEIIKNAYLSIPVGQHQASYTLGLTRPETVLHVIWPQMLPAMTAPFLNTIVAMVKDSAIVSVISVYELTMQAQQLISTTFRPLEFYLLAAVLYAVLTYPLLILGRWAERRYKEKGLLHDNS